MRREKKGTDSSLAWIVSFGLVVLILSLACHLFLGWFSGKRFLKEFNAKGIKAAESWAFATKKADFTEHAKMFAQEGVTDLPDHFRPVSLIRIDHGVLDEYGLPLETRLTYIPTEPEVEHKEIEKIIKTHAGALRERGEKKGYTNVVVIDDGGYRFFAHPMYREGVYDGAAAVAVKSPQPISELVLSGAGFIILISAFLTLLFTAFLSFKKGMPQILKPISVALAVFVTAAISYFTPKTDADAFRPVFLHFLFLAVTVAGIAGILFLPLSRKVDFFIKKPFILFSTAPAMTSVIVLIFIPFVMGVSLAFLDSEMNFIGFSNYKEIFFPEKASDVNFYFTLGVTILWTAFNVLLHVIIGLFLALLLSDAKLKLRGFYRVILILPWAIPSYITALIWKWMFSLHGGPINEMLELIGFGKVDWFGPSFWTNFAANLVTNIWLGFPFMMVVSLGALQSIPSELYEAADIDGAGRWQKFTRITLPLLKPALFPAIILGTIWTFNMFNVIYLVSGGAPENKTNILITEAYRAFSVLRRFGLAAAYSLIIFIILFAYTWITNRYIKATGSAYEN